jgi:hypothetical protein
MTWPSRAAAVLAFLGLFHATPSRPQDAPAPEEIRNDTDPTKPVFFTLRNEYYNLRNEPWQNVVILRADRLVLNRVGLFGRSRGFLLRADLPAVTVHDGHDTRSGLGDLYTQAIVIPKFHKSYTIAWGSGAVFPTATHSVGSDKWQLAPVVAPIVFFGRLKGFGFIKFQNFFSVAGEDDRPDLNYFLVTPTILRRISRSWWVVVDSESKTDWKRDNMTSFKSGFQIGKMMSPRFGVWVKPEIPWGQNRLGDWTVKATAILTRY